MKVLLTAGSGQHVEWVGGEAVQHGEVAEVVSSVDEQHDVDSGQEEEEGEEGPVVAPVVGGEMVRQLLAHPLEKGLPGGRLRWHQPFSWKILDSLLYNNTNTHSRSLLLKTKQKII